MKVSQLGRSSPATSGRSHTETEKSGRNSPPEGEEGEAAELMRDELTAAPIPNTPEPWWGNTEKTGSKVKSRKKGGIKGRCFDDLVLFLILLL